MCEIQNHFEFQIQLNFQRCQGIGKLILFISINLKPSRFNCVISLHSNSYLKDLEAWKVSICDHDWWEREWKNLVQIAILSTRYWLENFNHCFYLNNLGVINTELFGLLVVDWQLSVLGRFFKLSKSKDFRLS
jgi:hypothetical protein